MSNDGDSSEDVVVVAKPALDTTKSKPIDTRRGGIIIHHPKMRKPPSENKDIIVIKGKKQHTSEVDDLKYFIFRTLIDAEDFAKL